MIVDDFESVLSKNFTLTKRQCWFMVQADDYSLLECVIEKLVVQYIIDLDV